MYYHTILRSIKHYEMNFIIKMLILSDMIIWGTAELVAPIFAIFIIDNIPGANIETVGISMMIFLVTKAIFEMPIGARLDRTKTERDDLYAALVGTMLTASLYFIYPSITELWQLYVVQAFHGLGAALAFPGWYSIFTRHVDKNREGFEWSFYDVAMGVGRAMAAAAGAFAVEIFGFGSVFYFVGCMTFVGVFVLFQLRTRVI